MEWRPATVEEVQAIVRHDVAGLDSDQLVTFRRHAVEPYLAPILRYGTLDHVVVVARRENEVVYWEDVEEGFNLSPISEDGHILEHWCNQDELRFALNHWIKGRQGPPKLGPAIPTK